MAPFESQMAAQRGLMADGGLNVGGGQPESLMHHSLAMVQGQNRKSFIQLSLSLRLANHFEVGWRMCC